MKPTSNNISERMEELAKNMCLRDFAARCAHSAHADDECVDACYDNEYGDDYEPFLMILSRCIAERLYGKNNVCIYLNKNSHEFRISIEVGIFKADANFVEFLEHILKLPSYKKFEDEIYEEYGEYNDEYEEDEYEEDEEEEEVEP